MITLRGKISVQRLRGMVNIAASEGGGGPLQAKTVYPSHEEQIIAPDDDFYGLALVKVEPVPRLPICIVSVTAEEYKTHCLYNGIRLPQVPLACNGYPYRWIYYDTNNKVYNLVLSPYPWYYSTRMYTQTSTYEMYQATESSDLWTFYRTYTNGGNLPSSVMKWSNHDIPKGSATATEIYFTGTESVPTD